MTTLEKSVLARYSSQGKQFEIYVDPNLAYDYKKGKDLDLNEILTSRDIFRDAHKGERAGEADLIKIFGSDDVINVAGQIIRKGELQLTTDQRRRFLEDKRSKIIAFIAKEAIDPRTNAPVPIQRIELALEEAKVHIDPFKSSQEQIEGVVKALLPILPIKFEKIKFETIIPPLYTGKAYALVKRYTVLKEKWLSDGSLSVVVELSPSLQDRFFRDMNSATSNNVKITQMK
jgi:ribosome maturation protein SDO1